jgi:hypothetical protein
MIVAVVALALLTPHRVEVAEAEVVDERDRDQRDRQQRERDHGVTCRMA